MKPERVHLVHNDGHRVPFLVHDDGTVYEERESGHRKVHEPAVLQMVRRELILKAAMRR